MVAILVAFYVAGCLICGIMGRGTRLGFLGHLVLAAVITPVGDWLIQLAGRPSRRADTRDPDGEG